MSAWIALAVLLILGVAAVLILIGARDGERAGAIQAALRHGDGGQIRPGQARERD